MTKVHNARHWWGNKQMLCQSASYKHHWSTSCHLDQTWKMWWSKPKKETLKPHIAPIQENTCFMSCSVCQLRLCLCKLTWLWTLKPYFFLQIRSVLTGLRLFWTLEKSFKPFFSDSWCTWRVFSASVSGLTFTKMAFDAFCNEIAESEEHSPSGSDTKSTCLVTSR